jgi:hypothetical protein
MMKTLKSNSLVRVPNIGLAAAADCGGTIGLATLNYDKKMVMM